jgi:putative ATP-binding cassette transporter
VKSFAFLRDVVALAAPFWRSSERWRAGRLLALLLVIKACTIYVLILQNQWYKDFYTAIEKRDASAFWNECGWFCVLGFTIAASYVYSHWLGWSIKTHWRSFMVRHFTADWLRARAYYRMQITSTAKSTNPDQRIAEDVGLFCDRTLDLGVSFLDCGTALIAYTIVLWGLSGTLLVGGVAVPGYMVFAAFAFTIVSSVLVHVLGNPLVAIFDRRSNLEAEYRFSILRVRENAETVAFYGGEQAEGRVIDGRWRMILDNIWAGLRRERKLHWFQHTHTQVAILLPFLLAAPRLFTGQINLGEVMQIVAAFGSVAACLNFFITSYASIAHWRAETHRVMLFRRDLDALQAAEGQSAFVRSEQNGLGIRDLSLKLPDDRTLVTGLDLQVEPGSALLLKGPSGAGKSTLLRACAGLWPFGSGQVSMAPGDAFFVPQRPYLPLGTLREAACYPNGADFEAGRVEAALRAVNLAHLIPRLDEVESWSQRLSGGEQQRLAFARILLNEPSTVFLDEATSALDEENESRMYQTLRDAAWRPTIVSIGHRSSLDRHHDTTFEMRKAA